MSRNQSPKSAPVQLKWTEALVTDALREFFLPGHDRLDNEEWAFLTQVPLRCARPGYTPEEQSYWTTNQRTIDVLLVRNWSGGRHGHERLAIEVKVAKADYRNETDVKRAPAEASAHRCAYAAPAGLIDPDTLPEGWGLLEVSASQASWATEPSFTAAWTKRATRRVPDADPEYLISAGFRRASRAEERIRRGESAAAEIVALRAENESLRAVAARAQEARDREMDRAKAARAELLAFAGAQECATCGEPVTWKRGGVRDTRWQHVDRQVEDACAQQRWAAYRDANARGESVPYPSDPVPVAAA